MPSYTGVDRHGPAWRYRFKIRNPRTGRVEPHTQGGYETALLAHEARVAAIATIKTGGAPRIRGKITVEDFARDVYFPWLDAQTRDGHLDDSTVDGYKRTLRLYAFPELGADLVDSISPERISAWQADLSTQIKVQRRAGGVLVPRDDGTTLGNTTRRAAFRSLKLCLDRALDVGLIPANPALRVKAPKADRTTPRTWNKEQIHTFYEFMAGHRLYALVVLLFTTGMRRGEVCGLRWPNVDLDQGFLSVVEQRKKVGGTIVTGDPKSVCSTRRIDLADAVVAVLRVHRDAQRVEAERYCATWNADGHVFCNGSGRAYRPDTFYVFLTRWAKAAGLPVIAFHDGRHTAATQLLGEGEHLKVVSEMLGHSSVAITGDLYTHVDRGMHKAAANKLGANIPAPTTTSTPEDPSGGEAVSLPSGVASLDKRRKLRRVG